MFALTWFVAFMTAQGPLVLALEDATRFKDGRPAFVSRQTWAPRFHDYARGVFRASWDAEMKIAHECQAAGQPA